MPASGAGSCLTPLTAGQASPRLRGSRDTAHKVRVLLAHHPQELPAALAPGWAMWDTGARTVECCRPGPSGSVPSGTPRCQGCWGGTLQGRSGIMPSSQLAPRARSESGSGRAGQAVFRASLGCSSEEQGGNMSSAFVGPLGLFQLLALRYIAGVGFRRPLGMARSPIWPFKT